MREPVNSHIDIFRTISIISDEVFFTKILNDFNLLTNSQKSSIIAVSQYPKYDFVKTPEKH